MRTPLLLLFAAVLLAPSTSAATFGELIERYNNLSVGDAATVSNGTFAIGHLKLVFTDGKAAPVMAGHDVVGLFFQGNGTLQYDAGPAEAALAAANTRKESHLKSEGATLSGPVNEVMLLAGGVPMLQLTGAAAGSLSGPFGEHQTEFRHDASTPASHGLILQNLGAPATQYLRAEIRSGRDELVYVFDGADSKNESLYALRHFEGGDATAQQRLYPVTLSEQPIGRDVTQYAPPPFTLTSVDYTLTADGDDAKLAVAETIQRQRTDQKAIQFAQSGSRFVRDGGARRYFHVLSITDATGRSLPFHHENGDLLVSLDGITGETVKLSFTIEGDFLIREGGDNAWQLGLFPWFPQPESLAGQYYTVHSVVRVKKPFVAIAPGKTIKRGEEGDYNVVENAIDKPIQFAVVQGGKYESYEETKGGLTLRVWSYAGKNERAAKQLTSLAYSIIDYYQVFLGPFPWDEFNIIQVNTFGYGQAPPATMFITNEAFNSMVGEMNQYFSQGINERFAHEIAHQYWGHVVKMPSGEEQWLTESFAEYSAALLLKKYKGDGVYDRLVKTWKTNASEAAAAGPIPFANRLTGSLAGRQRTFLLYAKGPYVLYALNKELGDTQFMIFLKSYQKTLRWKFGTTNDLAGLLEFMTKKDYKPFFEKYFWGTAMPD